MLKLSMQRREGSSDVEVLRKKYRSADWVGKSVNMVAGEERRESSVPINSRQNVDIRFENLVYKVPISRTRKGGTWLRRAWEFFEYRSILRGVSGSCKTGQLTAILGPSGAGKSTLMNVLAGYKVAYLESGTITVNGERRDLRSFRKLSCYIMQDDQLLAQLTVMEAMMVAAQLKLSEKVPIKDKKNLVLEVLDNLGLRDETETRAGALSGGQRKRLSIALELVNNPPIMFFDEPTSGLDSLACYQCLSTLKALAMEGRTIVCTIHQPSAKLFELFDKLYVVASGTCIYKGSVRNLVPFLSTQGLNCPPYHNPADYVIEVGSGLYGEQNERLADRVREGLCERLDNIPEKINYHEEMQIEEVGHRRSQSNSSRETCYSQNSLLPLHHGAGAVAFHNKADQMRRSRSLESEFGAFATGSLRQLWVLFVRTFKTIVRDTNLTALRLASHLSVGLLIGALYWGIGNEATKMVSNAASIFFSMLFIMFTALMPTVMTFPIERKVLVKEHLNYWHSLKAYYFAKTMADTPFQIIFPVIYGTIVYWMTGQPNEALRFGIFLTFSIAVALAAQACGLLISAAFSLQVAVFLGPVTAIPILLFSGFFVQFSTIPPYLSWLCYASYVRYGFEGVMVALFSLDRQELECEKANSTLCIYRNPQVVLESLDMGEGVWWVDLLALLAFFVIFRTATYFVLRHKLRSKR